MSKRTPMKGEPDFTAISDSRLRDFIDLAQQMIFAYQQCDSEKSRVMSEVWKQLSDEYTDRQLFNAPEVETVKTTPKIHTVKLVKPLKSTKR